MLLLNLLSLLCVVVLLSSIFRIFFHPLAGIPGPKIAKVTGLWRSWRFLTGKWHEDVLDLHRRYGSIVRIAPNELSVVDHDINQKLYGRGGIGKKSHWYDVWVTNSAAPGMFAARDENQHAFLRKRVTKAYSMSTILASEADIQHCLDDLVQKLRDRSIANQVTDMSFWTAALAFDVVSKLALGVPLGMISSATDVMDIAKNNFQIFGTVTNLGHFPGQSAILQNRIVTTLLSWLGTPNPVATFQAWSLARIRERAELEPEKRPNDMLAHFMTMKEDIKATASSEEEVLTEVMIAIGAGADTVASAMRSCLLYISSHPEVYQKVQTEVDSLERAAMTFSNIRDLPYLRAACQEAMRLLPPIVFPLPRLITANLEINGFSIPANTVISTSPGAQNRDKNVFGSDANLFQPQRWLDDKTLAQKVMTFGGDGSRNCVGQNLALVEIYLFVAYMIRHFNVTIGDSASPWKITSYWIAYQQDMVVKLADRNTE